MNLLLLIIQSLSASPPIGAINFKGLLNKNKASWL